MAKGQALRYLVVGSKQNHTLQLWDLGLGKPVQEVNFPHENEMDAVCSVVYHPRTGILTVGHPTRNSVYLIHVSAPKYILPSGLTQADYIRRLADKDPTVPFPESTAIMSGMREISLSSIGQLRSLSVLSVPMATVSSEEVETVLELYIMHSKGLTSLTLTRQDIGIGMDGRPIYPVNAEEAGRINVTDLKSPPPMEEVQASEISSKSEAESWRKSGKENGGENGKDVLPPNPKAQPAKPSTSPAQPSTSPAPTRKRWADMLNPKPIDQSSTVTSALPATQVANVDVAQAIDEPSISETQIKEDVAPTSSRAVDDPTKSIETSNGPSAASLAEALSEALAHIFDEKLDKLYTRIDQDKRVQDAAGAARQEAVLRLVSSTLGENVEKNLTRIIKANMVETIVPSISETIQGQLDSKLSTGLGKTLKSSLSQELNATLPSVVDKLLHDRNVIRSLSEFVQRELQATLSNTIEKYIVDLSKDLENKTGRKTQTIIKEQIRPLETQQRNDSAKIDQLTSLTSELVETVKAVASTQSLLQREIAQIQTLLQQQPQSERVSSQAGPSEPRAVERDAEMDDIAGLMTTGKFEEGTIKVRTLFEIHSSFTFPLTSRKVAAIC